MSGLGRRGVLAGGGAFALAGAGKAAGTQPIAAYTGAFRQGGFVIVRGDRNAQVLVDGQPIANTGASGLVVVGFDRDAPGLAEVTAPIHGKPVAVPVVVAPVEYSIQRIDGLPDDQVAPSDPALLERINAELAKKQAALASRDPSESFRSGFVWPVEHAIKTSAFGPQRILNGVPKTPHYGVDLAVPTGTPIHAPANGLVVLAEPHMHFEGGLTLIDHGQGLISMYLHQSRQDVTAGQRVRQGQAIGAVGMTGRATGPHLCWRMTWRGRHMDPSLMIGAVAPA